MLLRVDDLHRHARRRGRDRRLSRAGDVIVLAGDMGTGKTAFAQGFGRALGVTEPITSPTFTLVHSYPLSRRLTLHHADIYRLERTSDIDDLALHELAAFNGIVLVEWGDVAGSALGDHLEVRLNQVDDDGDDQRRRDGRARPTDARRRVRRRRLSRDRTARGRRAWAGRWDRIARAVEPFMLTDLLSRPC